MKIEIDFAEVIEKYPVKELKTAAGTVFYQHQMNIKTKYGTTALIIKTYNQDLIKRVEPKQVELNNDKKGGDLDQEKKK
jgi:hypothetical protein